MTRLPRYPAGWCLTFLTLILFGGQYLLFQKPYPRPVTPALPASPPVVHLQYRMPAPEKPSALSDTHPLEAPKQPVRSKPEPSHPSAAVRAVTDQAASKPIRSEVEPAEVEAPTKAEILSEPIASEITKAHPAPEPVTTEALPGKPGESAAIATADPVTRSEVALTERTQPAAPVVTETSVTTAMPPHHLDTEALPLPHRYTEPEPNPIEHHLTAVQAPEIPERVKVKDIPERVTILDQDSDRVKVPDQNSERVTIPDQNPVIDPKDLLTVAPPERVEPRPFKPLDNHPVDRPEPIGEKHHSRAIAAIEDDSVPTSEMPSVNRPKPISDASPITSPPHSLTSGGSEVPALSEAELNRMLQAFINDIDLLRYYPKAAQRRRQEGQAVVSLMISPSSKIEEIRLQQSSSHSSLDQAALRLLADHKDKLEHLLAGQNGALTTALRLDLPVRFALR